MRCVIKECDRKATTRGLCHSCYLTALRLVQAGETTWADLEKAGLCGPLMRTPNAFAKAYQQLPTKVKDLPGEIKMFEEAEKLKAQIAENSSLEGKTIIDSVKKELTEETVKDLWKKPWEDSDEVSNS